MPEVTQRFFTLLSSNTGSVGTSAVQVSGGPASSWPLTAVGAAFAPSYHRQAVRITNTSPSATIYIGSISSITAGVGGGWFKALGPDQYCEVLSNGSTAIWMIATAASTPFTLEELQ